MERRPVIVKFGGSVITKKNKPLTSDIQNLDRLSKAILAVDIPIIIVHGGGSFGHFYASKYGLDTKVSQIPADGIAQIRASMFELNYSVVSCLLRNGISPYVISPTEFVTGNHGNRSKKTIFDNLFRFKLTPVSFGDVFVSKNGAHIVSGDVVIRALTEILYPMRIVFAVDVDGIFSDAKYSTGLIRKIDPKKVPRIKFEASKDATGGMVGKLSEALRISALGFDVFFVNGRKPDRVVKALKGERHIGTVIKGE